MGKSLTQKVVTLSVTEAELYAATSCAQDMLFVWQMMQAMQLQVKLPIILQCDNKGTMDLSKNWSTGGRTRHVDVRMYTCFETLTKKTNTNMECVDGNENSADLEEPRI